MVLLLGGCGCRFYSVTWLCLRASKGLRRRRVVALQVAGLISPSGPSTTAVCPSMLSIPGSPLFCDRLRPGDAPEPPVKRMEQIGKDPSRGAYVAWLQLT